MRLTIVELGDAGVVLRAGRGAAELVVPYEEILTAERVRSRGLDLHTRGRADPVRVRCQRGRRVEIESGLRFVGVRIVDCWGAILCSTSRRSWTAGRVLCDNRLTMPDANRLGGDPKLIALFDKYGGRLVSPGGAAALLGLTRQTIHTLCKRGELRAFRSDEEEFRDAPKWVYIPLDDIYAYGDRVGRRVRVS